MVERSTAEICTVALYSSDRPRSTSDTSCCSEVPSLYPADISDGECVGEALGFFEGKKEGTLVGGSAEGTEDSDGVELGTTLLDGNDETDGYELGVAVVGMLDVVGSVVGNGRHGDASNIRCRPHGVKVL